MNPSPAASFPAQPTSSLPPAESSGSGAGFVVLGAIAAAAVCTPLALLAIVAPKFAAIFADFGVALPGASVMSIRIGLALSSPTGVAALLLLAIGTLAVVGLAFRCNRLLGLALLGMCCIWFMISMGIAMVGLMLPLVAMIESLQQGGAV